MTAPSYQGPEVTAQCTCCGAFEEIPDPDHYGDGTNGVCGNCGRLCERDVWRGPVVSV